MVLGLSEGDIRTAGRAPVAAGRQGAGAERRPWRVPQRHQRQLMTIADLSTVWVTSQVPESYIRFVQVGERVEINLVAYPGETFEGRVSRIADTVDPQTRTVKVQAETGQPARPLPARDVRQHPSHRRDREDRPSYRPRPSSRTAIGRRCSSRRRRANSRARRCRSEAPRAIVVRVMSGVQAGERSSSTARCCSRVSLRQL